MTQTFHQTAMETSDVAGTHPLPGERVPRTLWWDDEAGVLRMIDQTLLPDRCEVVECADAKAVEEAIRGLQVRGAPAIGVAAGYGLVLGAHAAQNSSDALAHIADVAEKLRATRPTAVNLAWALDRLLAVARAYLTEGGELSDLSTRLLHEAHAIAAEDAAACEAMGTLGASLIEDGDTLLTHCNAGALATAGIGTALAPIFVAHKAGKHLHVFVDETRPVLQGARLTAWELTRAGVPLTLITDSMAAHFMRHGGIHAVFVGADRIAANGDVANKIGTYGLAVLAREHNIPFYVVAPRSTIDLAIPTGDSIHIEQRSPEEVTTLRGVRIAPVGVRVANPAFDVTPARYVAAIITEAGIARPPFDESIRAFFDSSLPLARETGRGSGG
ncbi:MAG TPA: S-methyl-5-thioribose-1-phosphate isomerase [Ktedonobacterales bacterium]|nr:S-methyl-5-thioribose-1-phosphate isomerase [Ktedonobacterales bacterium]